MDIPKGDYCYKIIKIDGDKIKTKVCPYWEDSFCHFLRVLDYTLLPDQVKICNVNVYDEELENERD